jgi:hypothetical protein
MPNNWSILFHKTLAEYVWQYGETCGNLAACVQVLKDCQKDITKSPLHKEQVIKLLQHLQLVQLEKSSDNLTPEEHKAAARPFDAGEYKTEWVPFRVA